jgi:hypothetical protein
MPSRKTLWIIVISYSCLWPAWNGRRQGESSRQAKRVNQSDSPRFLSYDRASTVVPLSKRSGRNVMGANPVDWDNDGDPDVIADQRVYENLATTSSGNVHACPFCHGPATCI